MTVLLVVGDCFEAFLAAPVVAALEMRGVPFCVACLDARDLLELVRLSPEQLVLGVPAELQASVDFALRDAPRCVAILGSSTFAAAAVLRAREQGRRTIHLDAGVRTVGGGGDARRRSADLAVDECVVAGETERRELLREGRAPDTVHMAGSLVAAAATDYVDATQPRFAGQPPVAHVALEHQDLSPALVLALQLARLKVSNRCR